MNTLSSYKILTITHKSTPLKNIGNFVLPDLDDETTLKHKLHSIKAALGLEELMYLSTCNRVLFLYITKQNTDSDFLTRFENLVYADLPSGISLENSSITFCGEAAISHLLEVASSVDSMVIGEREILRQMRESYDRCHKSGVINKRFPCN